MKDLKEIAILAGVEILKIYASSNFKIELKADDSPVTAADKAANDIIVNELNRRYPNIPVLAEESKLLDYQVRKSWDECFIVDPIDGTKEFIKKNGQFTVNIAFYRDGKVKEGVVFAPAMDLLYYTENGKSFRIKQGELRELPCEKTDHFTVLASNSHLNDATQSHIESLKKKYEKLELKRVGSSLKMCLVAEGSADYYPRLGPTSEWDTAASQAILEASGCEMVDFESEKPLVYNKENILNPFFKVRRVLSFHT